jgi:sigma-B regulation protein RsbU (phosphoserine phosphatase)
MFLVETQLSASEVLQIFHHDEAALFLGSAFTTVGIVTGAFCLLRRRFDALLVWLGVFAFLYGQRMWFDTGLLHVTLAGNQFFANLRWAVDFVVPIPAFLFFQAAGLMARRGKLITAIISVVFLSLAVAVFVVGRLPLLHTINNVLVIGALPLILIRAFQVKKHDHDIVVLRSGLCCFVVLALWDNIGGVAWLKFNLEPYGFAVLLSCLGYVAARRTLARDQQFGEIQKELDVARNIQLSILPGAFPASADFKVAARYVPMTAVAGDLYDFLVAGDRRAGLLIADVSGHGVPAALIASMVKMAATAQREQAAHPARLLAGMNAALCGNTQGQYVTAAFVYLDAEARELRYAAAGHPAMLLLRDGRVTEIAENGLLLAATESPVYTEKTLPLKPGDRLLLYTDGLVEARNTQGQMFGEDSLSAAVRKSAGASVGEAADSIIADVQRWAKLQDDDLTVMVCDFAGAG